VKKRQVREMVAQLGRGESAAVDYDEFVALMSAQMRTRDSRQEVGKVFRLFDDDGTGRISFRNLKRVIQMVGRSAPCPARQSAHSPRRPAE
jgi:centrin-1